MSAGGPRDTRRSGGLGRSTSVNSADVRRRESSRVNKEPQTSGSDQSVLREPPASAGAEPHSSRSGGANRAKSLGHARRESIQQRRMRREAAQEADVPEETDAELEHSGVSNDRLDSSDLAKPVFLKGLFSVSTTSGKSVPAIRADIRRVLKQLNVDYTEIKGGFSCKHSPSIDLNKIQDPPGSPAQVFTPGHKRRFSFGGLMRGDERERGEDRDAVERPPPTPRTPRDRERDRSYSNSETSFDSIPRRQGGRRAAPGETSTQVQSDLEGNMVLEFEIFIVKVPLLSLHGIQFKRMSGNTWQFKNMADQILKELKL
jgi:serine/threonine protein kinase KIN1/2